MDDQTIKNVLNGLNETDPVYLKIIHFKCLPRTPKLTNKDVGKRIALSDNAIYQKETQIRLTLASHGIKYPSDEVCAALSKYFTPYPELKPIEEPEPVPPPVPVPGTTPGPTPPPDPGSSRLQPRIVSPSPNSTHRPRQRSKLPYLFAGLGVLAIIFGGWWFRVPGWLWPERQADRQAALINNEPDEVATIVESIVEVTRLIEIERVVTVPPVEVTRLVEVIATVPIERQVEVTRLATVVVPQQVEVTRLATVEVPVTVEVTSAPTPEPTETSIPEAINIVEDFSGFNLNPFFRVISGEPQFAEGVMNMPNEVVIEFGDEDWRNYSYSFDVIPIATFHDLTMLVRDQGTKRLKYEGGRYGGEWAYLNENGDYVSLVNSRIFWARRVEIVVEDGFLYHKDHEENVKIIANTYSDKGKVVLTFEGVAIDNLVITRLD
jgi:hypothetical protein